MKKVEDLNREVRNFVNNSVSKKTITYSKRKTGEWEIFLSALDNLDDASIAIGAFQSMEQKIFDMNPYLQTYGLLQALIIQQDSLNYLIESLHIKVGKIDFKKKEFSGLKEIRDIRNKTIGHPVLSGPKKDKKGNKIKYEDGLHYSATITRHTLKKSGFEYLLRTHTLVEIKTIDLDNVLIKQESLLELKLKDVLLKLKQEEKNHKLKFKNHKLSLLLDSSNFLYDLNLIYGVVRNDLLSWSTFNYFFDTYKKIKKGIEARYGDIKDSGIIKISGTAIVINKLDYIFNKIESFKNTKTFEKYEFEIYVDSLKNELEELKIHLKEIDTEFTIPKK